MKKLLIIFFIYLFPICVSAQLTDDFSDGDFTNNPAWSGDNSKFEVDLSYQLHLNAPAVDDVAYLSTPSTSIDSTEWAFYVMLDFNPSSANYANIFLVSDTANLNGPLNGYFVKIGNTTDEISLYEKTGATETEIIDGVDDRVDYSPVTVRVKVIRDTAGNWQLFSDILGGTNYFSEGTVFDNTHTLSNFSGVFCDYTSTRSDKFYFDDFYVGTIIPDTIPPSIDTVLVLSDTTLDVQFSEVVKKTTAETLTNYSVNNGIGNPYSAVRDGTDSSLVHLTFTISFTDGLQNTLTVNNVEDRSGNTIITATEDFTFYIVPPTILSISVLSDTTIDIQFSEVVEQTTAETTTNYSVDNGIGNSSNAVRDGTDSSFVHLTFSIAFQSGVTNTLSISNVENLSGDSIISPTNVQFMYFVPDTALYKDVVINEIFADPSPQVGLPEIEYIELFNTGNKAFDLNGWEFSDGSSTGILSTFFLLSGDYVILCPVADTASFSPYGAVIGLSTWPTLNNSGDNMSLKNDVATMVDRVNYTDQWYNDPDKDEGGWSLELINPLAICSGSNNWTASINPGGGTPGFKNSVHDTTPDTQSPDLLSAYAIDSSQVILNFSELMDSSGLITGSYFVNNGLNVVSVIVDPSDFTSCILVLSPTIDAGTVYTITADSITDCAGNLVSSNNTARFVISLPADKYDVVISEIFPDPSPVVGLPEYEFVELYNNSNKAFDLREWQFADEGSPNSLDPHILLSGDYIILCDEDAASEFEQFGAVLPLASFPSLTNDGELLSIYDNQGNVIHSVNYSISWYGDNNKEDGGWSLEMIDPGNPCGEGSNWRASVDAKGGTPGQQNSVDAPNPDNLNPVLLRADAADPVQVILTFDEIIDSSSVLSASFTITKGIGIDSIICQDNKTVLLLLSTPIVEGIVYTVTVTGINDCVGNLIGTGNSADFALPEQGLPQDIIINEVLFNPRTGGSDFVEVYNNSGRYIDISNWKLANIEANTIANIKPIIQTPYVLFPEEYAVLTQDGANIKDEYPLGNEETFVEIDALPSYNDGDGTVILLNNLLEVSDSFTYDEDMHFALLNDKGGVSLERLGFNRLTNDATNWHSAAEVIGFATPGYKNSQFNTSGVTDEPITIDPEIFSPDNDGFNDVVNISYKFDSPGFVANITIYDSKGRPAKYLVQNELLGTDEGTFSWDGINENNEKARMGIYIIFFEVFDLDGNIEKYKETCVLGGRL
ncbi:MAG: lamin tail domain-containing protein [Bacteroidota bacterium]